MKTTIDEAIKKYNILEFSILPLCDVLKAKGYNTVSSCGGHRRHPWIKTKCWPFVRIKENSETKLLQTIYNLSLCMRRFDIKHANSVPRSIMIYSVKDIAIGLRPVFETKYYGVDIFFAAELKIEIIQEIVLEFTKFAGKNLYVHKPLKI